MRAWPAAAAGPGMRRSARQFAALLRKDLRLELRTRETLVATTLFAVLLMLVFQFAVVTRVEDPTPFAAGILWATLALTAVLAAGRGWVPEVEQRVLDGLLVAPVSRLVLMGARAVAIALAMAAVQVVAVPLVLVFFIPAPELWVLAPIALVCLLANVGIGLVGALFSAMAVFSRARELLLPVLFLPSLVPILIAATGATHAVTGGSFDPAEYRGYCGFLAVYAVIFGLVAYATYDYVFDD